MKQTFIEGNITLTSEKDVANEFNEYFSENISKFKEEIDPTIKKDSLIDLKKKASAEMLPVVYFDHRLGAAQPKRWSK